MHIVGPLLVAALVGLVVLIVVTGRRRRAAMQDHFAEAARVMKLSYLAQDDGTAQSLAQGFDPDEFARFTSPSLGAVPPTNVVHGKVSEGYACLFSHHTRRTEGDARQWFIAIVDTGLPPRDQKLIKCRSRKVRRVEEIGGMAEVDIPGDPDFAAAFLTQAMDEASARNRLDADTRRVILDAISSLGYPVDVQIAGNRIAVYPAHRNYDPESSQELAALLVAARKAAGSLK